MSNDDENLEHPALKKFNEPLEYVKAVGAKALKWAAVGALIGGLAVAVFPAAVGALISTVTFGWAGGTATAMTANAFLAGAMQGGAIAGLAGAVVGIAGAGDVVDEKKEQFTLRYERNKTRMLREQNVANALEAKNMDLAERRAQMMGLAAHGLPPELQKNDKGQGLV